MGSSPQQQEEVWAFPTGLRFGKELVEGLRVCPAQCELLPGVTLGKALPLPPWAGGEVQATLSSLCPHPAHFLPLVLVKTTLAAPVCDSAPPQGRGDKGAGGSREG